VKVESWVRSKSDIVIIVGFALGALEASDVCCVIACAIYA